MRGRKPKPTMLKDLHGSKEPRNEHEPKPVGDLTDSASTAPDYFNADQLEAWEYVMAHAPPGLLKLIDAWVLEVWVVAHCLHRSASKAQARYGLVIPAPNTRLPIQSPYLPIINRQALIMLRAASELGFSPTARPRVGMATGGDLNGNSNGEIAADESIDGYLARAPHSSALN